MVVTWCSDVCWPASHRAAVSLPGETACGGWRWLSGCLDGLDRDIKGKQKVALWRGHRRGQASLFSIQVRVCVQGYLSCREIGGGVGLLAVTLAQIYLTYNMCDCIFYFMFSLYSFYLWRWLSIAVPFSSLQFKNNHVKCKMMLIGEGKASERHLSFKKKQKKDWHLVNELINISEKHLAIDHPHWFWIVMFLINAYVLIGFLLFWIGSVLK